MPRRANILPLLFAILIASSSIGVPVILHECLMSGTRSIAFSAETVDCCKGETPTKAAESKSDKTDCCTSTEAYQTLDASTNKVTLADVDVLPILYLIFENVWAEQLTGSGTAGISPYFKSPTPPPAGRELLASISLLRI